MRFLRVFAFAGLGLVLLIAALIGFSETQTFRSMLRDVIVEAADSSLNARLSIASIEGNLFAGWKISGVQLRDAHGTVADIESIVLRYNIFRLPWKRVTINELTINGPRFHITKAEGRDWNIATLVRPSADEDTTTTPFDWVIAVENLRIVNGMLLVYDSTVTDPLRRDRLDTRRMRLDDLNLALSAMVRPDRYAVRLNQCSWTNPFGDVALENLAGDLSLRPDGVDVSGLSVQTTRTSFLFTATVEHADVLGEIDTEALKRWRMHVLLDAPEVDARDLQYFLPSLDFLGGTAALRLSARGTLERLRIERLELGAGESSLGFQGSVSRILDGTDMHIDAASDRTVIRGVDVAEILPGIPLPDLGGMGTVQFATLRFTGQPLNFEAEMDMRSDAGDARGAIALDIRGEELVYEGSIHTHHLDLSKMLRDPQLRSAINLDGTISGRGTRLGGMTAQVALKADSSRFMRLVANELAFTANVRPDSLHFDLRSAMRQSRLIADGAMSFQTDSITGIRLWTEARKLDLATFLDDDALASDLNFRMDATADGIDLSTASGDLEVVFASSQLADLRIDADTFRLQLQQRPGDAEFLLLESQYADARIDGRFDLPRLATHAAAQIDSLAAAFAAYTFAPDTLRAEENHSSPHGRPIRGGRVSPDARDPLALSLDTTAFMDARYTLTLKNPDRIARYFNASTFLVRGTWRGGIRGGVRGLDVDGELALSDFYLVDSARTWLAAGVRCTYDIQDLRLQNVLADLVMNLRLSAADLNINGLRLSRAQVQLDWADGAPSLRVRGLVDTLAQVDLQVAARYADHGFDVTAPRLQVIYRGQPLQNRDPIVLRLDSTGITLHALDIGNDAMRLEAHGIRDRDGENDFTVYADSVNVTELEFLLTGDPAVRDGASFSGIGFLEATFRGSDVEPMLAADVFIDSLGYRGAHFGEMALEARYDREMLELYSELTYATPEKKDEKVLFVSGSIPLAISFGDEEAARDREASANLRMQLREFPLALIEEFLGLFSPLSGVANADFTVTGTASDPSFNGFLAVSDARGRFIFNNIEYDLGLRIEALDRDIRIVDLSVANVPSDWRDGRMSASGMISTEAFSVKNFDLAVRGRLKVLKFASRSAIRTIYGDLYVSTGAEDLTYGGRLDRSMLRGDIIVEQGELVFPLDQNAGAVNKYADINYLVVDDTTKRVTSSLSSARFARLTSATATEEEAVVRMPERSVLDGLGFALTLSTAGRLRLEIPFSVLQEELNAELVVNNLQVNNFGGSGVKFVGEVTLGQDSYFIFLGKRMTASGTIRFTRDPLNPDLDLTAVYSDYYIDPRTQVRRPVFVTVRITGSKNAMKLDYDLRWDSDDGEQVTTSGDVKSDVVSFLVFGVFTRDLSSSEGDRSSLAEKSPEFLNQITSSIASSAATEFLNQAGLTEFIRRVDFAGLGTQDSRVKLTSEIGRAIITYDGKINDLESSNMSVDFPLSRVLGIPWTNLMVQVSRKTLNESYESTSQSQQYSVWELKILQRFSF
ncbi:MAG: translocation/assembly module TamB domain-containing protein [Bacteroidota bacterium]|jgi:hypothetical protein|nr:translocation/assembly module TamB domain-containing protein [Bacteroidota bacterium]